MPERVKIKFTDDHGKLEEPPTKRQKFQTLSDQQGFVNNLKNLKKLERERAASNNEARLSKFSRLKAVGNQSRTSSAQRSKDLSRPIERLWKRANELLTARKRLPIWSQADDIRDGLRGDKDVLLLVGETGSGKSTQVPQFLINETWCKCRTITANGADDAVQVGGCIAITEPRKVAAVSLARRVAEEMGTPLGSSSPLSTVGYHVRFDQSVSPNTKIKFLTEGMLLQELLRDPWLKQYSAVIVDEVHERSVNVDLILGFLRNILSSSREGRGGLPLKTVVMSATADLESLLEFFNKGYLAASRPKAVANTKPLEEDTSKYRQVSICRIKGRQYPVKVLYSPSPSNDIIDAALRLVFQINYKERLPGDILVFLTGQETVESLERLVNSYSAGLKRDVPKILALPMFAALSQTAQQRVFEKTPRLTRKVIIATNIAETSVTVPGVRHVIDCGKSKVKQFRVQLGLESLLCKPISQSAATQRKGRAGREAPGTCYRVYPEDVYAQLDKTTIPEILRCDVAQAILTMKARGIKRPWEFPLLSSPPLSAIAKGLEQLYQLGALDAQGEISELGSKVARLPLSAALGKILLTSMEPDFNCLMEMIDIISCLSVDAIFLQPSDDNDREKASIARTELIRREGDHLTLLATMQAYTVEQSDRKVWCETRLVSHRAMRAAWEIRKQLRSQVKQFENGSESKCPSIEIASPSVMSEGHSAKILRCLLNGFVIKTAVLCPDGAYRTCEGKHELAIHPASVLFGKKVEAIVYNEFVYTNRGYARDVSAVRSQWIDEALPPM